jgi:hypothetical protein
VSTIIVPNRDVSAIRERAAEGARLKEHLPALQEAVDIIESQYADALMDCHDPLGRERLWQAVQVCRKVKQHFGAVVSGGTLALHQLQELSRPSR